MSDASDTDNSMPLSFREMQLESGPMTMRQGGVHFHFTMQEHIKTDKSSQGHCANVTFLEIGCFHIYALLAYVVPLLIL
jgi:hypothetical protein